MDNFSVVGDSFDEYLLNLSRAVEICKETNLILYLLGEVTIYGEGGRTLC